MKNLNNRYFALRHGQSKPNISQIILSHPEEGKKDEYTLTSEGENQVRNSLKKAKEQELLDSDTVIYSSPFSRCKKTAQIAKEVLGVKDKIIIDDRLQERWFGDWEKSHNSNYQKVWEKDRQNPKHQEEKVESAFDVLKRTISLIEDLEKKYTGKKIILVSHGDALQILQAGLLNKSPSVHREIESIDTAEIKELKIDK